MKKKNPVQAPLDRRGFMAGMAAGAGSLALAGCGGGGDDGGAPTAPVVPDLPQSTTAARQALARPALPDPASSGIDHIVLVTMENRSFDHYLGWVPGAEGLPPGVRLSDAFGQVHSMFPLAATAGYGFASCGYADPNHTFAAGRVHLADGRRNGWLLTPETSKTRDDLLPIGYYRAQDLDFYRAVAAEYTVCDYYFSGILSETIPNRLYLHSGQTDRLGNSVVTSLMPTIWERLAARSVSANYFYHDVPFTALYGPRHVALSQTIDQFHARAAAGTLPAFSMVDPRFGGASNATSNDDHPHTDVRNGQALLGKVYESLRAGPNWAKTLMIIVYDEWGGFFDHVEPHRRPVSFDEAALGNDGRLGFRVPCMLLGPRARRASVARFPFDPSSIHQLLSWRFGLESLGVRGNDAGTFNLAYALDFTSPARTDRVALPLGTEHPESECPSRLSVSPDAGDRKNIQTSPDGDAGLPGGHFHDVWLKAQANGFFR